MDKEDIDKLLNEGVSIEDIANKYGSDFCVVDFEMDVEFCGESVACCDCWDKCLNKKLDKQ